MNSTHKRINDITYLMKEFDIELGNMTTCVSRLEEAKDTHEKQYRELD